MSFERQIRSEHFEIAITKSFLKIHFAIVLSEFHDEWGKKVPEKSETFQVSCPTEIKGFFFVSEFEKSYS